MADTQLSQAYTHSQNDQGIHRSAQSFSSQQVTPEALGISSQLGSLSSDDNGTLNRHLVADFSPSSLEI